MPKVFKYPLLQLQPSQLFISREKLTHVLKQIDFNLPEKMAPIPIKSLSEEIIYTDGHTRALAAHQRGLTEIPIVWDEDDLDWEAYEICVGWCMEEGIYTIADLKDRVISHQEYKKLWYERCTKMQNNLKEKRIQTAQRS